MASGQAGTWRHSRPAAGSASMSRISCARRSSDSAWSSSATPPSCPDGLAAVLICHHVLEHVPVPTEALTEIRRLLHPQGQLLLRVPYEPERRYRRFDPNEPNHHRYSWTGPDARQPCHRLRFHRDGSRPRPLRVRPFRRGLGLAPRSWRTRLPRVAAMLRRPPAAARGEPRGRAFQRRLRHRGRAQRRARELTDGALWGTGMRNIG